MTSKTSMTEKELEHLVYELCWFVDFFNIAFFIGSPVAEPVFSFETNREKSLGHFPVKGKGYSKDTSIYKINPLHGLWQVLLIVLHLMVHSWQSQHNRSSKSWFHNKEFRKKMAECGIKCNQNGCCTGLGDPFVFLLKKHGVIFGNKRYLQKIIRTHNGCNPNGKSKLKKWSCGCQNARIGRKSFEATCDKCGNKFEQED
jgi:hypothetical protein